MQCAVKLELVSLSHRLKRVTSSIKKVVFSAFITYFSGLFFERITRCIARLSESSVFRIQLICLQSSLVCVEMDLKPEKGIDVKKKKIEQL